MDTIDMHERLSELVSELDKRQPSTERPFWFVSDGENDVDESITYCWDCLHNIKPNAEPGGDYMGGGWDEHDHPQICEVCGKLLRYVLSDYGVTNELAHFVGYGFDWDSPTECFELARVAHGICENEEQSRQLYEVLITGKGCPKLATD